MFVSLGRIISSSSVKTVVLEISWLDVAVGKNVMHSRAAGTVVHICSLLHLVQYEDKHAFLVPPHGTLLALVPVSIQSAASGPKYSTHEISLEFHISV